MRKHLLAGVALTSFWAGSALAADIPFLSKTPVPNWAGWYSGTQFAMECLSASHDSSTTGLDVTSNASVITDPTSTNSSVNNVTSTNVGYSTAQGNNCGAKLALYGGYNVMWGNSVVLGAQLEGGVANVRVNMTSNANGVSSGISTGTNTSVTPGFPTAVTTSLGTTSTTTSSTGTDTLDNRWQFSALGRVGVLLDPLDLLYVIGGYTYARFDYLNNYAVGMNGGTIGGGWERQIVRGWTVKVEGRYTKFANKNVTNTSSNTASLPTSSTAGTTTIAQTFTDRTVTNVNDRFSASIASILIGVSYYFGS
jgi:opacity protein-like surface antigen